MGVLSIGSGAVGKRSRYSDRQLGEAIRQLMAPIPYDTLMQVA
jgi:hypothetical protein